MIASRSGRYWYSEATDTPASSATRVVVSTAGPSATRMRSAAASTCISRSRLRACCGIRRRPAQSRSKASVICTAAPLCHISGSSVRLPSVRSRHASACPASCAVYRSGDSGSPLLIAASRNGQTPITRVCQSWSPTVRRARGQYIPRETPTSRASGAAETTRPYTILRLSST